MTSALTGDITSLIVHKLVTTAATKIAEALPPGAGQVTAVLDLLYKGLQFLSNKDNVKQLQELLQSSSAGVREIVDGVVDGKPGGLSQVSHATYNILEKATGPALSFVATQLGLGSVPEDLAAIFKKLDLRSYVYAAAYKLAEKVKSFAGFGKLSPAPLSEKVPLGNGQNLWLMKGQDGKAHLVLGDPQEVKPDTPAEQNADTQGTQLIQDEEKVSKDLQRLEKNPKNESLVNEVKTDEKRVENQKPVTYTAEVAAEKDVTTSAPSGEATPLSKKQKTEIARKWIAAKNSGAADPIEYTQASYAQKMKIRAIAHELIEANPSLLEPGARLNGNFATQTPGVRYNLVRTADEPARQAAGFADWQAGSVKKIGETTLAQQTAEGAWVQKRYPQTDLEQWGVAFQVVETGPQTQMRANQTAALKAYEQQFGHLPELNQNYR